MKKTCVFGRLAAALHAMWTGSKVLVLQKYYTPLQLITGCLSAHEGIMSSVLSLTLLLCRQIMAAAANVNMRLHELLG